MFFLLTSAVNPRGSITTLRRSSLEILISKSAKKYITNLFKKYHPCSYLDSEYFKTNLVYKIVKDYEENKIDKSKTVLIYRLFTLSKLLQDIKY